MVKHRNQIVKIVLLVEVQILEQDIHLARLVLLVDMLPAQDGQLVRAVLRVSTHRALVKPVVVTVLLVNMRTRHVGARVKIV